MTAASSHAGNEAPRSGPGCSGGVSASAKARGIAGVDGQRAPRRGARNRSGRRARSSSANSRQPAAANSASSRGQFGRATPRSWQRRIANRRTHGAWRPPGRVIPSGNHVIMEKTTSPSDAALAPRRDIPPRTSIAQGLNPGHRYWLDIVAKQACSARPLGLVLKIQARYLAAMSAGAAIAEYGLIAAVAPPALPLWRSAGCHRRLADDCRPRRPLNLRRYAAPLGCL